MALLLGPLSGKRVVSVKKGSEPGRTPHSSIGSRFQRGCEPREWPRRRQKGMTAGRPADPPLFQQIPGKVIGQHTQQAQSCCCVPSVNPEIPIALRFRWLWRCCLLHSASHKLPRMCWGPRYEAIFAGYERGPAGVLKERAHPHEYSDSTLTLPGPECEKALLTMLFPPLGCSVLGCYRQPCEIRSHRGVTSLLPSRPRNV